MKKPRPQLVIDISDVSYYDIGMEDFLAMIKACIFDLDGTIGNTLDSMVYSVNMTLKEMSLSEIALSLGITYGAAAMSYHRTVSRLRNAVGGGKGE